MKSSILDSALAQHNATACGPPETRVWFFLGVNLKTDLEEAKKGRFVRGSSTEDVCDFFSKAEREGKREDLGLALILSKDIYCVTRAIRSMDFSIKISNYFFHQQGVKKMDEFYDKYLPFVTACRKVTGNILKAPKVRLSWDSDSMKRDGRIYEDFVYYLREKADRDDSIKSWDKFIVCIRCNHISSMTSIPRRNREFFIVSLNASTNFNLKVSCSLPITGQE